MVETYCLYIYRKGSKSYVAQHEVYFLCGFLSLLKPSHALVWKALNTLLAAVVCLTHSCPPLHLTFAVRESASLGIMGAPEVPPLYQETSVSRTANVGTVGMNGQQQSVLNAPAKQSCRRYLFTSASFSNQLNMHTKYVS